MAGSTMAMAAGWGIAFRIAVWTLGGVGCAALIVGIMAMMWIISR